MKVTFIETHIFSRSRAQYLSEESFRAFEEWLLENLEAGDLIVGTGGCRKVRWAQPGRGKSGGVRIIYYYKSRNARVFLLMVYPKSLQDNLTVAQKNLLRNIIKQLE